MSITVVSQAINLGFFSIFAPIIAKLPSFVKLNTSDSSSFPVSDVYYYDYSIIYRHWSWIFIIVFLSCTESYEIIE